MTSGRYAGPVEERIPGALMHCRTTLPNHECPQLRAGCLGCTFSGAVGVSGMLSSWWPQQVSVTITADERALRVALARKEQREHR